MISLGKGQATPEATPTVAESKKSVLHLNIIGGRVTIKDLVLFSRQLAVMIGAGVPIVQALQSILRQIHKEKFREVLTTMIHSIRDGDSLSAAMSKHPKVFSPFILGVVTTGEASGQLVQSLTTLADHLEQDYAFLAQVLFSVGLSRFNFALYCGSHSDCVYSGGTATRTTLPRC